MVSSDLDGEINVWVTWYLLENWHTHNSTSRPLIRPLQIYWMSTVSL